MAYLHALFIVTLLAVPCVRARRAAARSASSDSAELSPPAAVAAAVIAANQNRARLNKAPQKSPYASHSRVPPPSHEYNPDRSLCSTTQCAPFERVKTTETKAKFTRGTTGVIKEINRFGAYLVCPDCKDGEKEECTTEELLTISALFLIRTSEIEDCTARQPAPTIAELQPPEEIHAQPASCVVDPCERGDPVETTESRLGFQKGQTGVIHKNLGNGAYKVCFGVDELPKKWIIGTSSCPGSIQVGADYLAHRVISGDPLADE